MRTVISRTEARPSSARWALIPTRLILLGKFISELPDRISPSEADAEITRIDSMPHLYKRWMLSLASAIACTGFAFLNRGGLVECLVVFIAAGAGQFCVLPS